MSILNSQTSTTVGTLLVYWNAGTATTQAIWTELLKFSTQINISVNM